MAAYWPLVVVDVVVVVAAAAFCVAAEGVEFDKF